MTTKSASEQILERIKKYSYDKGLNPLVVNRNQCYVMIIQALYLILLELKKFNSNFSKKNSEDQISAE